MKSKSLLLTIATTLAATNTATLNAATLCQQDSTCTDTISNMVVYHPDKVSIQRTDEAIHIDIKGQEGNPDYHYNSVIRLNDQYTETTALSHNEREWNFLLPFTRSDKKETDSQHDEYRNLSLSSFGVGLVGGIDTPEGMNIDMSESWEFSWDILELTNYRRESRWTLGVAFGVNWRNYRMTGAKRFVKEDNNVILSDYPTDAEPKFSRLKMFSLTIPFTLSYALSTDIFLSFSPIFNINTYASVKTRYKLNDEKQKETFKGVHQNKISLDLRASVSVGNTIGFYFKYTPFNILKSDYAPAFKGYSTGIFVGL